MSLPPIPADGARNWWPQMKAWSDALEVSVEGHVDEVLTQWAPDVLAAGADAVTARDQTIALRDEVEVISGLTGEDEAVALLASDRLSVTGKTIRDTTGTDNARDYGAMGDGITDDRAALQAAIDSCAATGQTLRIPAGTYIVSAPLNLKSYVHIRGAGTGRTIIKKTAASANTDGVDAVIAGRSIQSFSVAGLSLIGNRSNYADGNVVTTDGMHLQSCSYFIVSDMRIERCRYGIQAVTIYTCSLDRVTAVMCQDYAFRQTTSSTSTIWSNCTAWGCKGGFDILACIYVTIIGHANDHSSYGGHPTDPFLYQGSGGNYQAPGYIFKVVGSTVTIIGAGTENTYAQYLYCEGSQVSLINPYVFNMRAAASPWRFIELRGTSQSRVAITGSRFIGITNELPVSAFRSLLFVEKIDQQNISSDMPMPDGATFGEFAYIGSSTNPLPSAPAALAVPSAPVAGTWRKGQRVENSDPGPGEYVGWICTTGGTPGTWKGYGLIEA